MKIPIDTKYLLQVLTKLLEIPSPTGYTDQIVHAVGSELEQLGIPFELTRRGAIRATIEGEVRTPDRAVVAHLDTLGAMVKWLKDNGRLSLVSIGTWSSRFAEGARVTVFTDSGLHRGSILPLMASGHTHGEKINVQPISWDNIEVRLDEPVTNARDLTALGINIGDHIAIDTRPEFLPNGFINARHLDDKAGVAAILAAAKAIVEEKPRLPTDFHLLFTISEEVGSGASAVLHGDVAEMVTLDNATPAPFQASSEFGVTIAMADSAGPFDYHLVRHLIALCVANDIQFQRDVFVDYRSDSASAVEAGNDIRTALVAFGVDASHGYERTHLHALESSAQLLVAYMMSEPVVWRDRKPLSTMEDFPTQPIAPVDYPNPETTFVKPDERDDASRVIENGG